MNHLLKLDKQLFLMVCRESANQGYNKLLQTDRLQARLLPNHLVVLEEMTLLDHRVGAKCEPDDWQMRVMAWGMLNTSPVPVRLGFLDVNIRTWQAMQQTQEQAQL